MSKFRSVFVIGSLVVVTTGGVFTAMIGPQRVFAVASDRYQELQIFTKVLNLIQQYYVEEVDTKKLLYGGIKGMLQELDPHTNFLPPDIYKEFETETSGEFGGLGIEITLQNDVLTVISPIEDTPAWQAGVKAGDRIVEINGESTKGLSLAEAAQKMRGKKGDKVRMMIYREGFDKPKEFAVTRGVVKVKSVKYTNLEDGFGYIRLTSFIENSAPEMERVVKAHVKNNKENRGLIIDLRRNPGGLLDQAIRISDLFLDKGVIVSTIGRNKTKDKEVVTARKDGSYTDFPIIVLINEYSASASEILAGALQDNHRALIMGQRSFGKGSVQSVVKLGDGSGLKLTVARYYTPSGVSIQAEGIKPDVAIDDVDPEQFQKAVIKREVRREQDIDRHLPGDHEAKDKSVTQQNLGPIKAPPEDLTMAYWWTKDGAKKKDLTPKEKILSEDFQVLQAYNYLRAWKVMTHFHGLAKSQDEARAVASSNSKSDTRGTTPPNPKSPDTESPLPRELAPASGVQHKLEE